MSTPERGQPPITPRTAVLVVTGVLLVALYWSVAGLLPQGAQEFAYFPSFHRYWPWGPMRGFTVEQAARHVGWTLVLGPALLLLWLGFGRIQTNLSSVLPTGARLATGAGLVGALASAGVMFGVLRGRATTDDELTYADQASLLLAGQLGRGDLPSGAIELFSVRSNQGWTGKYLPGEPLVQTLGVLVGVPALLHLGLYAVTLTCFYRAVVLEADKQVAGWATALLALSPMFVLTTATGLSHTTTLAALVAAGLGAVLARQGRSWAGALLVAAGVGAGLLVRPHTATVYGLPLVLWTVWTLGRARRWGPLLLAAGVGGLFVGVIGLYNHALTGSYTALPWSLQTHPERYGFYPQFPAPFTYEHTVVRALENTVSQLVRLNQWAFGWPLSLGVVLLWMRLGRPGAGLRTWGWPALAAVGFQFGYYSPGGSDTGPIYWYETLPALALVGGHSVVLALRRWQGAAAILLMLHLLLGTLAFTLEQGARLHRLVSVQYDALAETLAPYPRPLTVIYSGRGEEARRLGWIYSRFPLRSHAGDLITVPDGPYPRDLARSLALAEGRTCVYVYFSGESSAWVAMPCEAAEDRMRRPWSGGIPLTPRSTAEILGLVPARPWTATAF